jgi:hypothetical protein
MLNRPIPNCGESLTGYLQRLAQANYVSSHELWRWFSLKGKHYPQSSMARVIDFVPGCLLDLKKMSSSLNIETETLLLMTFQDALSKFYPPGTAESQLSSSKILSGVILHTGWFCPECLEEVLFYKLICQVKEIEFALNIKSNSRKEKIFAYLYVIIRDYSPLSPTKQDFQEYSG